MHDAASRNPTDQSQRPASSRKLDVKLYAWLSKLQQPRARQAVLGLALVLASPSLFSDFAADDYILQYELRPPPVREWPGSPPWDLYQLYEPETTRRAIDGGGAPWWFYENTRCGFLRVVSGFTHLLDEFLAPGQAFLPHLHSWLWLGLLIFVVGWAYRRLIDLPWVAAVSGAMFALDAAHGATLSWIVNRSAFVGTVFAVLTLACHHRYRRGEGGKWSVAACACLAVGMFAGELTLGVMGYLAAYALFMERDSWLRRALTLAPYVPVLLVWAVVRKAAGYGTEGWTFYTDPLQDPLRFLLHLPERVLMLLASQATRLNADVYDFLPATLQPGFVLAASLCCAVVLYFSWPALRTRPDARFWATGALLSCVPMCAAQPSDRLLTMIGVGVMPLLAHALHATLEPRASGGPRLPDPRAGVAVVISVLQLVIAPLSLPFSSLGAAFVGAAIERTEASLPTHAGIEDQTAIVVAVPDSIYVGFLQLMRYVKGKPKPRRLYWLVATPEQVAIERRTPEVLRLTPALGFYERSAETRSPAHAFARDDKVELSDMTVHILELNADGRPAASDFAFREPLESSSYLWFIWRDGQLAPWQPPAIGATTTVRTAP